MSQLVADSPPLAIDAAGLRLRWPGAQVDCLSVPSQQIEHGACVFVYGPDAEDLMMMDRRTALRMLGGLAVGLAVQSRAADVREITWLALVPKDWNPRARLGKFNVEGLEDSDPKAQQYMRELREVLDTAPTVTELDGALIKMPGYVVPLEQSKDGLREFLLVPYYGACIHTPPPPANQIVHVKSSKALKGFDAMAAVWVTGTLKALRRDSGIGVSGYTLDLAKMEVYRGP